MKNVLNAQERTHSIGIFLFSFVVTVACILAAVYFNSLIPNTENGILRSKIENFEMQIYEQQQFIVAMEEIQHLTDSLKKINEINPLVKSSIEQHLRVINQPQHKEGELYGRINTDIFNFIYDYTIMNEQVIGLKDQFARAKYLEEELSKFKDKVDELNRDLDFHRKGGNLSVR